MFGKKKVKLDRKMRRRIRKTTAAMLLISAITVAAIPVPDVVAADEVIVGIKPDYDSDSTTGSILFDTNATASANRTSVIPDVPTNATVYSSERNIYRFAYYNVDGTPKAILLGATADAIDLNTSSVEIPETLAAYVQYTTSQGTYEGFAAANMQGHWLYYKEVSERTITRTGTWTSSNGGTTKTTSWTSLTDPAWSTGTVETNLTAGTNTPVLSEIAYTTTSTSEDGQTLSGTATQTLKYYRFQYKVCYMDKRSEWSGDDVRLYALADYDSGNHAKYETYEYYNIPSGLNSGNEADWGLKYSELTMHDNDKGAFVVTDSDTQWLRAAEVACISGQRTKLDSDNKWVIAGANDKEASDSFFSNASSIVSISLPEKLLAVAPKTFSSCTVLESVTFTPAIQEIGAAAFENCTHLTTVNMPYNAGIKVIAENTFYNCQSLNSFTIPASVTEVGDSAFSGCRKLNQVDFTDPSVVKRFGRNVFQDCTSLTDIVLPESLSDMGYGTFKGCSALEHVTLPETNKLTDLRYSAFEGCTSLKWIDVQNVNTTFETSGEDSSGRYPYDVDQFKADVGEEFYFRGRYETDAIHRITSDHEIAFQYRDSGNYEKIVRDENYEENNVKYTYTVSNSGQLLGINIQGDTSKVDSVVIASQVGPHKITSVGSEFSNGGLGNENLVSITIPSTITTIGNDAFKGCVNLERVIFEDPCNVTSIGAGAFDTQANAGGNAVTPLTFYGTIDADSIPFQYAMSRGNNINNPAQPETYIDFCSGNPTYIHVKYNSATDKREVWKVPTTSASDTEFRDAIRDALEEAGYPDTDPAAVIKAYSDYLDGTGSFSYPDNVEQVVKSAFDITLPTGIQTIAAKLFSSATADSAAKVTENLISAGTIVENAANGVPLSIGGTGGDDGDDGDDDDSSGSTGELVPTNTDIRKITMEDIEELDDYAFYACENLKEVVMYSSGVAGGESIGDYAFGQCTSLTSVVLPTTTSSMGTRPFAADTALETAGVPALQFIGEVSTITGVDPEISTIGDDFMYENGIVYEAADGTKDAIVQCLPTRGSVMGSTMAGPAEFAGVSSIYPEAFMDCKNLGIVDLEQSNVEVIPEFCFNNADRLTTVTLPITCKEIKDYAFKDSGLTIFTVPYMETRFAPYAFYDSDQNVTGHIIRGVEVITAEDSTAEDLAESYRVHNWKVSDTKVLPTCTITFQDEYNNVIAVVRVQQGSEVVPPTTDEINAFMEKYPELYEGKFFAEWFPKTFSPAGLTSATVTARFSDTPLSKWNVEFRNDDYSVIATYEVENGSKTPTPPTPTSSRGNYTFSGWSNADGLSIYDDITQNVTFMANYNYTGSGSNDPNNPDDPNNPNNPNNPNDPNNPNNPGDGTNGGDGNNGGNGTNGGDGSNGSNGSNGSDGNNSNQTLYTLTVVNGSGSGSYAADTQVTVAAYTPNTGYEFYNWTSSESDTDFTSKTLAATSFKMPAKNLTITANYRTKSETGNSITSRRVEGTITSAPSSNTGSVSRSDGNSDSNNSNSGTSVEVNRPGISNGDIASATVNGSTDNFVIKVTEDGQATAAVAEALRNEYGSLENIHYFAMDISLYDETGTTKVTDTSGISVTITLPLPDELRQYAGNNKVAAVTGGNNLDKLNPRFTTVSGVPCVTFTATHFSPYTIYVDTANLSEGAFDTTPKTGDPIHPKWFLAIGLGLFSAVLFLKKDKRVKPSAA